MDGMLPCRVRPLNRNKRSHAVQSVAGKVASFGNGRGIDFKSGGILVKCKSNVPLCFRAFRWEKCEFVQM